MVSSLLASEAVSPKPKKLAEPDRVRLAGIVSQMEADGVDEGSIRAYVEEFKRRNVKTPSKVRTAASAATMGASLGSQVGSVPAPKQQAKKGFLDNLGGVLVKGSGNPIGGMAGTGTAPIDEYTKASVKAGVKKANQIVKDTKESFTEAIPSLDKIPGGRLAQRIAPGLVGPGDKGYAGHIAGAAADIVTSPVDIAADAANLLATGEWQAAANLFFKTGAFVGPVKGAAPAIAKVAGKTKAGRSLAVGQAMKETVKSGIGSVPANVPAQIVATLMRAGATEDEAVEAVGAAIRQNEPGIAETASKTRTVKEPLTGEVRMKDGHEFTPEQAELINARMRGEVSVGDRFYLMDFGNGAQGAGKSYEVVSFGKTKQGRKMAVLKTDDGKFEQAVDVEHLEDTSRPYNERRSGMSGHWARESNDWEFTTEPRAEEAKTVGKTASKVEPAAKQVEAPKPTPEPAPIPETPTFKGTAEDVRDNSYTRYIEVERDLGRIVQGSEFDVDINKIIDWIESMRDVPYNSGGNTRKIVINALRSRPGRERSSDPLFEALIAAVDKKRIAPRDAVKLLKVSNPTDWEGINVDEAVKQLNARYNLPDGTPTTRDELGSQVGNSPRLRNEEVLPSGGRVEQRNLNDDSYRSRGDDANRVGDESARGQKPAEPSDLDVSDKRTNPRIPRVTPKTKADKAVADALANDEDATLIIHKGKVQGGGYHEFVEVTWYNKDAGRTSKPRGIPDAYVSVKSSQLSPEFLSELKRGTAEDVRVNVGKPVEPKTVAKADEPLSVSNRGFNENPDIKAPKGQGQSAKKLIDEADIDADEALDLSRRIADGSEAFNPENAARTQTGVAKLQKKVNDYAKLMDDAEEAGDSAGYQRYREQYESARANLQEFADNVQKGKSGWSDVGRILAAGVDENGNFAAMQESYARAKGVKVEKLTKKETVMLKSFADEFNRITKERDELLRQVNEQKAANAVERGRTSRRAVSAEALKTRKAEAAKAISEEVQKILTAPVASVLGAGGGGGGAVNFGRLGRAIRDYADVLVTEGVQGLDNVVQAIREAFPALERQQIINMLGESEAKTKDEVVAALAKARRELKIEAKKASDVGQGKLADKAAKTVEAKRAQESARKARADAARADRLEREGRKAEAKKLRDDIKSRDAEVARKAKADAIEAARLEREGKKLEAKKLRDDMRARAAAEKEHRRALEALESKNKAQFDRVQKLKNDIAEYERKLKEGDFAMPDKKVQVQTKQAERLEAERDLVRKRYEAMRAQAAKNDSVAYKVTKTVGDTIRGSKLGFDLGAMLRQGFFGITHPAKMTKAIADGFKSMRSDVALEVIQRRINGGEINGKPASKIRSRAGLYIADTLSAPEETFAGNLIEKIPLLGQVYKAGERFTTGFLNTYRVEMFDWFAKRFPDATEQELKNWAKWINSTSGRSNLKEVSPAFGLVLTSPRYAASRFEVIGRIARSPFTAIKDKAERRVFIEAVKTGTTVLGAMKMAEAAGAEVNFDYTSSDFLKIRVGDTVYDPTAGIGGTARLLLRTLMPIYTGKTGGFGKNVTDEVGKFAVGKVSPAVSSAWEIRTGKSLSGFELPEDEKGWNALLPVIVSQLKENIKKDGYLKGTIKTTPELVGIGSNAYPKK